MNKRSAILRVFIALVGLRMSALAQGTTRVTEIEALKQRVTELEEQNRAILKVLEEIRRQLKPAEHAEDAERRETNRRSSALSAMSRPTS